MKKKNSGILAKIIILLSFILAVFLGGYFFLDKLIVPKYFSQYGINGLGDLVNVVASLYSTPNEAKMISNGYTQTDFSNAVSKMQKAGYKIEKDGTIKSENMNEFKGVGRLELTDREFAAVCNGFLSNGLLEDSLSDLNYLNITELSVLDLVVTLNEKSKVDDTNTYTKANIDFIIKVNTTKLREQIADQMDTPIYLLKMIIPDILYFEVSYDIDLENEEKRTNGVIEINGRGPEKSESLINVLIGFIFDEKEEMDLSKFIDEIGTVALQGIDALGDFKFAKYEKQVGIVINENAENLPEVPEEPEVA